MSDEGHTYDVPDAVGSDPDEDRDRAGQRLDDDFDVASAREQEHHQTSSSDEVADPSEAKEVVDGS